MKFGITQLWAKTPPVLLRSIQGMAALGIVLIGFLAKADYPAELENILLKMYFDLVAGIAILSQFFGVETTDTYPVKK